MDRGLNTEVADGFMSKTALHGPKINLLSMFGTPGERMIPSASLGTHIQMSQSDTRQSIFHPKITKKLKGNSMRK